MGKCFIMGLPCCFPAFFLWVSPHFFMVLFSYLFPSNIEGCWNFPLSHSHGIGFLYETHIYHVWSCMHIGLRWTYLPKWRVVCKSSLLLLKLSWDLESDISYPFQKTITCITLCNIQKLERRQTNKRLDLLPHDGQPVDLWGYMLSDKPDVYICIYFLFIYIHLFFHNYIDIYIFIFICLNIYIYK